jgi:hypothetical protein
MTRPIDGVASIQQPVRLQDVLHSSQRQAQIPQQAQERDAERQKTQAQERVERDEALLGQTVREDDPRQGRRRRREEQEEAEPAPADEPAHIDLLA